MTSIRHITVLVLGCVLLTLALSACGRGPSEVDIEATVVARIEEKQAEDAALEAKAQAMAKAMVEATAQAVPTATSAAPTPTPTHTPTPSATPIPTTPELLTATPTPNVVATVQALVMAVLTALPSPTPTSTPLPRPTPAPLAPVAAAPAAPAPTATPLALPPTPAPSGESTTQPPPSVASREEPSIADVLDEVMPWVVSISAESQLTGLFYDFNEKVAGSGFVIRTDGHIVTSQHLVQGSTEIKVYLSDGKTYDASIVGQDELSDLAVIKIDAEGLPTATFGNSDELRVGDWVLSVGNAFALKGSPTVTLGIVSGLGRTITIENGTYYGLIQTDAAINKGNSGGPLINLQGEVVGINQAVLRDGTGMGFALSSAVGGRHVRDLIDHSRVVRPLIGLTGADVTPVIANELQLPVSHGIIVTSMPSNGPAYKEGIRAGDVITGMDGQPTPDMSHFLLLLWSYEVGDRVQVEYLRDNERLVATVELARRPG